MKCFLVFFEATQNGKHVCGNLACYTNGAFLNNKAVNNVSISKNGFPVTDLVVTNIIKLTKAEYEAWGGSDEPIKTNYINAEI